ncbi:hypothetical protein MKQ70_32340 [Chitinophaga sedimenti]|uniref:hypothetical protein n=1 Tax=Chitinophaga sedimenti TaxID=2033606 RepID=UPI002005723F|nr:hypothetical protein [Chitinophaga sedimenti]MCK7559407.1 hypothetical protein [Chitinophaga sedimenti]
MAIAVFSFTLLFMLSKCHKAGPLATSLKKDSTIVTGNIFLDALAAGKADQYFLTRLQNSYGPINWPYYLVGTTAGQLTYLVPICTPEKDSVVALLAIEYGAFAKYRVYDRPPLPSNNPAISQETLRRNFAFFQAWINDSPQFGGYHFKFPQRSPAASLPLSADFLSPANQQARIIPLEICYQWITCTGDGKGNCIGNIYVHTECVSGTGWIDDNFWPGQTKITGIGGGGAGIGGGSGPTSTATPSIVVSPPDNLIKDLAIYLRCFDRSQPGTITLYVNQPLAGSDNPFTLTGKMGHVFIGLEQDIAGVFVRRMLGFHPAQKVYPTSQTTAPSALAADAGLPYDVALSIPADAEQFGNALAIIEHYRSTYDLEQYNCTDFALDVMEAAGRQLPRTTAWWLVGRGRNPASLGEDLRKEPDVNTTKGHAPQNTFFCQ